MTASKTDSFPNQSVEIGRVHVVVTQSCDRIETLLVSDDEDDIWAFLGHDRRSD